MRRLLSLESIKRSSFGFKQRSQAWGYPCRAGTGDPISRAEHGSAESGSWGSSSGDTGDNVDISSWKRQDGRAGVEWGKREVVVTEQTPEPRAERRGETLPAVEQRLEASAAGSVTQGQVRLVPIHIHCQLAKFTFS